MKGLGLDVELLKEHEGELLDAEEVKIKLDEARKRDYGTGAESDDRNDRQE